MQANTVKTAKTDKELLELVKEQFPDMEYVFIKPKKKLTVAETSYREFLRKEVLKNLVH